MWDSGLCVGMHVRGFKEERESVWEGATPTCRRLASMCVCVCVCLSHRLPYFAPPPRISRWAFIFVLLYAAVQTAHIHTDFHFLRWMLLKTVTFDRMDAAIV